MVIISRKAILDYAKKQPLARHSLFDWYQKTTEADWSNLSDVKNTFGSADYVGNDRVVFNIHGNRYRLVAAVIYATRTVYIKFIGTHAEYDTIDVKTISLY